MNKQISGFIGNPEKYIKNDDVVLICTNIIFPRAAWFRKEVTTKWKVKDIQKEPWWKKGNDQLMTVYEAAVNALITHDIYFVPFERWNIEYDDVEVKNIYIHTYLIIACI